VALRAPPPGTPLDRADRLSWFSPVVVGRPALGQAKALRASLEEAAAAGGQQLSVRRVGEREVLSIVLSDRPWRSVHALVTDEVFVLGVGDPVIVDRVAVGGGGGCGPELGRQLLRLDGLRLAALVERLVPTLALLGVLAGEDLRPGWLTALGALGEVRVAAPSTAGAGGPLRVAISAQLKE
jgi:hypothetical protein